VSESSDAELLRAWQTGDAVAGAALFDRYGPGLHRFFADKARDVADDLVQQTFAACVEALQSIETGGGGKSFRAFVYTLARRRLIDHLRRFSQPTRAFDPLTTSIAAMMTGASTRVGRQVRDEKVRAALAEMPLDTQLTFELHYWHDLTVPETASALGVADGTVKARLSRGREKLRDLLGDDFEPS